MASVHESCASGLPARRVVFPLSDCGFDVIFRGGPDGVHGDEVDGIRE